MFHKKTTPYLIAHNFGKCWPIFTFFTFGLSNDCVMKWSLKIPSYLKRVDTLPCKTLVFKNWSNYHVNCIFRHLKRSGYVPCNITLSFFFYKFWWSLSFPRAVSTLTFCASFAPPVRKCNNVRDPYLQTSGHRTASIHFITKSGAASLPQKAQDVNDLRRHLFDAWVGV